MNLLAERTNCFGQARTEAALSNFKTALVGDAIIIDSGAPAGHFSIRRPPSPSCDDETRAMSKVV